MIREEEIPFEPKPPWPEAEAPPIEPEVQPVEEKATPPAIRI